MKNKFSIYIPYIIVVILVFTAYGCDKDNDEVISQYIKVDTSSFTFEDEGNEKLQIKIEANPQWNSIIEEDWINAEETENILTVSVKQNTEKTVREGKIIIQAGEAVTTINIRQLEEGTARHRKYADLNYLVMSPAGTYMATVDVRISPETDEMIYYPVLIEVSTNTRNYLSPVKLNEGVIQDSFDIVAVSDAGSLIGSTNIRNIYLENEQWKYVSTPQDINVTIIQGISSDGTIWVGYTQKFDPEIGGALYFPVKWTNNTYEILPLPEYNSLGDKAISGKALGCSADGKLIYGSLWNQQDEIYGYGYDNDVVLWKDEKVNIIGEEFMSSKTGIINGYDSNGNVIDREIELVSRIIIENGRTNMSTNGQYIVATYLKRYAENKMEMQVPYPALYNLQTEEWQMWETMSGFDGTTVSDDGVAFATKTEELQCMALLSGSSNPIPAQQWINQHFGIITQEDFCLIEQIGANSRTVLTKTFVEGLFPTYWWWLVTKETEK